VQLLTIDGLLDNTQTRGASRLRAGPELKKAKAETLTSKQHPAGSL
jgi:hypothetical protein